MGSGPADLGSNPGETILLHLKRIISYQIDCQVYLVKGCGIAQHLVTWSLHTVDICRAIPVSQLVDFLRPINWLGNSRIIPAI